MSGQEKRVLDRKASWDGKIIPKTAVACVNCKFWFPPRNGGRLNGECRRQSPCAPRALDSMIAEAIAAIAWEHIPEESRECLQTESTEAYLAVLWPQTDNDEWCGEFKSRRA